MRTDQSQTAVGTESFCSAAGEGRQQRDGVSRSEPHVLGCPRAHGPVTDQHGADRPVGSRAPEDVRLVAGDTVELLPPFAGG